MNMKYLILQQQQQVNNNSTNKQTKTKKDTQKSTKVWLFKPPQN